MEVKSAAAQKSLLAVLSPGKRARLHRLLFEFGPGEGTLMLLPIDQGIEHGPRDFFPNPDSKDPEYQFRLAAEAGYSAIACQIGLAEKYYPDYAGQVPLILKVNGKTEVPPDDPGLLNLNSSVEDGVRLGADAIGYTMYLGSPRQDEDLLQLKGVREDCDRFGMPLVIWAYPRGEDIQKKGGRDSFYAIDYGARMAMEMGADVVKLNMPKLNPETDKDSPAPYNEEGRFTIRRTRSATASLLPAARSSCSPVDRRPTTRPCSVTLARSWRRAVPASSSAATSGSANGRRRSRSSPRSRKRW